MNKNLFKGIYEQKGKRLLWILLGLVTFLMTLVSPSMGLDPRSSFSHSTSALEPDRISSEKLFLAQGFAPNYLQQLAEADRGSFIQPVGGVVTSEFGNRIHPITGELRLHKGIDIGGNAGQSVVASASGTVIIAGVVSGYGNFVEIKHGNGLTSAYAHLASFSVIEGEDVAQGQKIGVVGATGGVTGPHLHFEIFKNGVPQNPRDFLNFA